ncbi:MAG: DUF3105 domain-containing protein [Solirubrobacteraceae bacterium]|nr:DUF3105 domain-containing protein [Solirubrobacteraceae bacterium]
MSSRQEEKERRRRERQEQEAKAQAAAARARRLQIVGGVAVALVVVVVVVVLVLSGGGDDERTMNAAEGDASTVATRAVTLPERRIENLEEAAEAAGCRLVDPPNEGATHVEGEVEYEANPPTSGSHNPTPAADGIYDPGNPPAKENYVHSLEHGRILFQYAPGAPDEVIGTLEALYDEELGGFGSGYHMLVFENNTGMEATFGATAWDHAILCDDLSDEAVDALRAFRERYTDKGPEFVP